jgi:hypothetical protein
MKLIVNAPHYRKMGKEGQFNGGRDGLLQGSSIL